MSCLQAMRLLHGEYAGQVDRMRAIRQDRLSRDGINHSVGTVFRHKKYGYRGVVYGWDRSCERGADWAKVGSKGFLHLPTDGHGDYQMAYTHAGFKL